MYKYKISNIRVVDGDTIEADIDLGFKTAIRKFIRLYNINAPEVRGKDKAKGKESKAFLKEMLGVNAPIILWSIKDKKGKYGRIIGTLKNSHEFNLNLSMVAEGYAEHKIY